MDIEIREFSKRLKKLRIKRSMTQFDLSVRTGIDCSVISKLENNKTKPSVIHIILICNEFNVKADWLLFGTTDLTDKE